MGVGEGVGVGVVGFGRPVPSTAQRREGGKLGDFGPSLRFTFQPVIISLACELMGVD